MDLMRTGVRFLSRGMRGGNAAVTLLGALLAARGILKMLYRPSRELIYSRRLAPGEHIQIGLADEV